MYKGRRENDGRSTLRTTSDVSKVEVVSKEKEHTQKCQKGPARDNQGVIYT